MKKSEKEKTNNPVSPALKQEFRNLSALIEDNNHKLTVVAEHVGSLTEQVGSLTGKVGSLTEKVDSLAENVGSLTEKVGSLTVTVDVIKSDVEIIKSNLKRKVDLEEFEALTHRVSVLEKRMLK